MTRLHVYEWGEPDAPLLVAVHGVGAHGRRFRKLAEERLAGRFHVVAVDLRGHGRSTWEPPWRLEQHVEDLLETVGGRRATWVGHSFGGRLVLHLPPEAVERAALLDPAVQVLPHVALDQAEATRADVVYASEEEAVEARIASGRELHTPRALVEEEMREHLQPVPGGLAPRFCRSAVVAAWGEMAREPPAPPRVPTLLVVAEQSHLVLDEQVDRLRARLGDLLRVVHVPGGHVVMWDAFAETADALDDFLG